MAVRIEIEGVEEAIRNLEQIRREILRILSDILVEAASILANDLRSSQLYDDDTGALRRSIRVRRGPARFGPNAHLVSARHLLFLSEGYQLRRGGVPVRYIEGRNIYDRIIDRNRSAFINSVRAGLYRALPEIESRLGRVTHWAGGAPIPTGG